MNIGLCIQINYGRGRMPGKRTRRKANFGKMNLGVGERLFHEVPPAWCLLGWGAKWKKFQKSEKKG